MLSLKGNGWKRVRASIHGTHRAAFWRTLGFPNLAKGRAVLAAKKAARERVAQDEKRAATLAGAIENLKRR